MTEHATEKDFKTWRETAKALSTADLMFTIKDCRKAEESMRGWNPIKEGFYSDQGSTFSDELRARRAKNGIKN
jgi:hypothetical protein